MRFHKSESAFFVFIAVIFAACALIIHAYTILSARTQTLFQPTQIEQAEYLARLLFIGGAFVATALLFGVFFIYPLIRTQIREEGKLRAMTATLSARSETLEHAALD